MFYCCCHSKRAILHTAQAVRWHSELGRRSRQPFNMPNFRAARLWKQWINRSIKQIWIDQLIYWFSWYLQISNQMISSLESVSEGRFKQNLLGYHTTRHRYVLVMIPISGYLFHPRSQACYKLASTRVNLAHKRWKICVWKRPSIFPLGQPPPPPSRGRGAHPSLLPPPLVIKIASAPPHADGLYLCENITRVGSLHSLHRSTNCLTGGGSGRTLC